MYKLIIVDDKADIIRGIRSIGKWPDYGIEVVGSAYDGQDALQLIEQLRPEIVLTDIRMPVMDGLKLTEHIKRAYPEIKVIILSGYDEFSYAQQAVKLGAEEYLLKPVTIEQLHEVVSRIKEKLDREALKREAEKILLERLEQSLPLLRDRFFLSLTEDAGLNQEELAQRLEFLKVKLPLQNLVALATEVDRFHEGIDQNTYRRLECLRICIEELSAAENGIVSANLFTDKKERLVWIIAMAAPGDGRNKRLVLELADQLKHTALEQYGIRVSIGIGRIYPGLRELRRSYQEGVEALSHKLYLGGNQIIHIDDIRPGPAAGFKYPVDAEKELLSNLKLGADREVQAILERYFLILDQQAAVSPKLIKQGLTGLIILIFRLLAELKMEDRLAGKGETDLFNEIAGFETLEDFKKWTKQLCEEVLQIIQHEKKLQAQHKMEMAKEYIEAHLETEISLNQVAEYLGLSPNYFSTLFRKYHQQTFMEYLVRARVEKAKQLLQTGRYKVYEVANLLGYSDARYFSEIFKTHTGVNPAEYGKD